MQRRGVGLVNLEVQREQVAVLCRRHALEQHGGDGVAVGLGAGGNQSAAAAPSRLQAVRSSNARPPIATTSSGKWVR